MSDTKISKTLSLVLRHAPEKAGLTLKDGGWVMVDELLRGLKQMGQHVNRETLDRVVANNDKKRFQFSEDGMKIRAVQGHSTDVEMNYEPAVPPEFLFHGSTKKFVADIFLHGLKPMKRQLVHLSLDKETAKSVGSRHGAPVIFTVEAGKMAKDGLVFHRADNGVWLTTHVPPQYLNLNYGGDE